jgi:type I restriction enzyme S subunit
MSNYKKLGDISTLKTGPFGTQLKASEYVDEGVPVINVRNIGYGNLIYADIEHITEETRNRLKEHTLQIGDIVFGRKGSVDRHCLITERENGWFQGSDCLRVRITAENVSPEYVSYFLLCKHVLKGINNAAVGSTMASINMDIISNIPVLLPSYNEQNKIASILKAIDSKIEVSNRINVNLQQMAKTLYDYWFTQFDFPDENGRPYRSSGGRMVWNEKLKKQIPITWTDGTLEDIAQITMGQSPEGSSYNEDEEGTLFFQGSTDFGLRFPYPRVYTTNPSRIAKCGDILLSVRAPVGALNVAMNDCCIGRGLAALHSKNNSQLFLYYTLDNFKYIFNIMNSNGTTFGSITKDYLLNLPVIIPTVDVVHSFELQVSKIEKEIRLCEQQNRELTKLRDWLLPMLMNGQVTITD